MRHLVIDADSMVYAAAHIAEKNYYTVVDGAGRLLASDVDYATAKEHAKAGQDCKLYKRTELEPIGVSINAIRYMLRNAYKEVKERFGVQKLKPLILLTGSSNYRDRLASLARYKFNRVETAKPRHYGLVRKYLVDELGAVIIHWYEADDEAAILLTEKPAEVLVSSIDKDLLQVPGWHYLPGKGFLQISEKSALIRFYIQALAGDSTDGIPGCKGMGNTGAKNAILEAVQDADSLSKMERAMWATVLTKYRESLDKKGAAHCGYSDPEQAAVETARLVYLLRERPSKPESPTLWEPPA